MDIRVGAPEMAPVQAPAERRNLPTEPRHEPAAPAAVIVEVGRPVESAGTYNAKGVVENPATTKNANMPPPKIVAVNEGPLPRISLRREETAAAGGQLAAPEALAARSNPSVRALANTAPDRAASARTKGGGGGGGGGGGAPSANAPTASGSFMAPVAMLNATAVKQAEKSETPAQHEEDADAIRKEKDPREKGHRRPRR